MFTSSKYSYLALRLGLATVFLWFGIDKIFHPTYWFNAWVASQAAALMKLAGLSGMQFIYLDGIFEILVGLSLLTGIFTKFFSLLAIIFLTIILFFVGFSEVTIRNLGFVGGFVAIILWPDGRRYGF